MKRLIIFFYFCFIVFSCEIKSEEQVMGTWSYKGDGFDYELVIQTDKSFVFSKKIGEETSYSHKGELYLSDKILSFKFLEPQSFKGFHCKLISKNLFLQPIDDKVNVMLFKKVR